MVDCCLQRMRGGFPRDVPGIHDGQSSDQPQMNINNSNVLGFYHQIRRSLSYPSPSSYNLPEDGDSAQEALRLANEGQTSDFDKVMGAAMLGTVGSIMVSAVSPELIPEAQRQITTLLRERH